MNRHLHGHPVHTAYMNVRLHGQIGWAHTLHLMRGACMPICPLPCPASLLSHLNCTELNHVLPFLFSYLGNVWRVAELLECI